MSRAKGKSSERANPDSVVVGFGKTRWVNVGLDDGAREECIRLAASPDELANGFIALVGAGLDVSLKRAERGEFMACLFGTGDGGERLGLSAWGESYTDAVAGLLVKFHVMLGSTLSGLGGEVTRPRFR